MVFVGWILLAADPNARIQTQVPYLEGDFRTRGWQWGSKTGKGNEANTSELSNDLCSGQLKFHPTGSPGRPM